jgi:hypothetical protein
MDDKLRVMTFYVDYCMFSEKFDPSVWGPHYWFFLHTIARSYPIKPTATMQKKYYNFYQDLPLFIPIESLGNNVASLLDKYPVSPYLGSRESLTKWTTFVHNKVNAKLMKDVISRDEADVAYWGKYRTNEYPPRRSTCALYYFLSLAMFVTGICITLPENGYTINYR